MKILFSPFQTSVFMLVLHSIKNYIIKYFRKDQCFAEMTDIEE